MEDHGRVLKQKLDRLLKEAAEVSVELDRTEARSTARWSFRNWKAAAPSAEGLFSSAGETGV